ncbi:MlaD family protein [Psychroserpens sp. Hel_I_66]|uniref:MlaD family protein n=1 Tax=Psychroserpens sp. Hel_I_66 TaxID=1250004 RepID=UPI0006472C26|nr:MlaD family protein [Psychroserpens sp. Hel_I_66]
MKISREVKTAILVLSGILLMVFLINYLNGKNLFETDDTYYTEFDYNALSKSSPVTVKGNSVGKIQEIIYNFDTGKTRVSFTVDDQLSFSKETKVKLYKTGLMGGNALEIMVSEQGAPAKPGDFLASEVEEDLVSNLTETFSDVSNNLDTTLSSADSLLLNLNRLVIDDTEAGLKNAIKELNETMKSFKAVSYSVNNLIKKNDEKLSSVLTNFDSITQGLAVITNDLKDVQLSKTVEKLDNTINTVNNLMVSIENGEGSVGKLLKDEGLYQNLEGAALQMEQLLEDMKLNPKRYVHFSIFGKKPKRYDADGNEIEDKD